MSEMKKDVKVPRNHELRRNKYFAELEQSCANKGNEWDERCKNGNDFM